MVEDLDITLEGKMEMVNMEGFHTEESGMVDNLDGSSRVVDSR